MANNDPKYIQHVGVLGMHWGHRKGDTSSTGNSSYGHKLGLSKQDGPVAADSRSVLQKHNPEARKNREKTVEQLRNMTGLSTSGHKDLKKMSDAELDNETATLSMHHVMLTHQKEVASMLSNPKVKSIKMSELDKKTQRIKRARAANAVILATLIGTPIGGLATYASIKALTGGF